MYFCLTLEDVMIVGVLKENFSGEKRVALLPDSVARLAKAGIQVVLEPGLGITLTITDEAYQKSGGQILPKREILSSADLLLHVRKPPLEEIPLMKKGAISISFLDPFNDPILIKTMAASSITAVSLEMIPRTTFAQKMDALSSQSNLVGYVAVILAAERLNRIFPLMMTPAGTINPSRVFVVGAGVAGLQAIATAKRLGARVEAFDPRPDVEEQVRSLGAKFLKIDLGETGQTQNGYARGLSPEQLDRQRQAMTKTCAQSDVVITTAQVFGRKAPIVITRDMIAQMKPGSIVVDTAIESGGNVEGAKLDQDIDAHGVRILGLGNLPSRVAFDASLMFSNNMVSFIETFLDREQKIFRLDLTDPILKSCVLTHAGQIVNETLAAFK